MNLLARSRWDANDITSVAELEHAIREQQRALSELVDEVRQSPRER